MGVKPAPEAAAARSARPKILTIFFIGGNRWCGLGSFRERGADGLRTPALAERFGVFSFTGLLTARSKAGLVMRLSVCFDLVVQRHGVMMYFCHREPPKASSKLLVEKNMLKINQLAR